MDQEINLHHSHVEGGDLPKPWAVHLLSAQLLQDDAGLVHVAGEGSQVQGSELVPEVRCQSGSVISITRVLTHTDLAEKEAPLLATILRCLVSSPSDWTQR